MKKILSILLMLMSTVAFSQVTQQTIQWSVTQVTTIATATTEDVNEKIISYGTSKIEWLASDGTIRKTFVIKETNGSWSNVQNAGSVTYEVESGNAVGNITFKKDASGIFIQILLIVDQNVSEQYELAVNTTTIL
jgi:hypothetical protein